MDEFEDRNSDHRTLLGRKPKSQWQRGDEISMMIETASAFAVPSSQGEAVLAEQMSVDPYIQKVTPSNGIDMCTW
ncbi:hypothetical protein O9929_14190 [Vibrio lentus]|nr:hypothetical protein [Vibrio lentus]